MKRMYRGTAKDARECKDWPRFRVEISFRARDGKQAEQLTQWAFDTYFYHEAKMIHFGSDVVPIEVHPVEGAGE